MTKKYRFIEMRIATAGLVLIVGTALIGGCSKASDAAGDGSASNALRRSVTFQAASSREVSDRRMYVGGLRASASVALYPLLSERIVSFPVEEGSEVESGDVVAQIRATGLRQGRAQVRAQIEALDETLAGMDRELSRTRELHEHRIVPQQSLDQLETTYRTNLAQHRALQASLGQLSITAGNAVIRAPFDGVISNKRMEEGDIASPQVPLCHVVQVNPIRFDIAIVERDLGVIRVGMRVEVTVDAWPDRLFAGEVTRVLPVLDAVSRTNEVWVEIHNPTDPQINGRLLKPGMFARAAIVVEVRPDAVVIPVRALMVDPQGRPGYRRVMVLEDGDVVRQRMVQTGVTIDDVQEILSGLAVGERVVVRGQYGIADGDSVTATEDDSDDAADATGESR